MSPRRMDISSLLRAPSPPHRTDDRRTDKPRTIDALLHHPPASLLSILNTPHPAPLQLNSPANHAPPRPPLGLDALVHVASEERRRITAVTSSAPRRDSEGDVSLDRDRLAERDHPSLVLDQDRSSRHHAHPLSPYPPPIHRHSDISSPLQDNSRPNKRARDALSTPPASSPESRLPLIPGPLMSPSTRHHPSASLNLNYPTLRQPTAEPCRSAPALLSGSPDDSLAVPHLPSLSLQHTSPFSHSHSSQLPIHSSPRNSSPHRYSPQRSRSQLLSSPIPTGSFTPPSAETDSMSLHYGYGPRMAGGIGILSNDPSSINDLPRTDPSNYQSPRRDMSTERFVSESHPEHIRHGSPQPTPFPRPASSPNEGRHQAKILHQAEDQEFAVHRGRVRPHPSHSLLVGVVTDHGKSGSMSVLGADFASQPPPERHPIRVWEEQPTPREISRRVSPVHMPDIIYGGAKRRKSSTGGESGHDERPTSGDWEMQLRQHIAEDVLISSLSACKEKPSGRASTPSGLRTPSEGIRSDPPPLLSTPIQPQSLAQSEPQIHLPQPSLPNSSVLHATASPVLDLHLMNFEAQCESVPRPERSEFQVDANTSTLSTSSDPTTTEPSSGRAEIVPEITVADDILMSNPPPRQPSPELAQPVLVKEPGTFEMSTHSTHANVSQSTNTSHPQQPLSIIVPAKNEHNATPQDILILPHVQPERFPCQPPSPERTSKRELPVSEQTMMDVDEELLSLVEDNPPRAFVVTKAPTEQRLPLPTTIGQGTNATIEQGSSEVTDGPSPAYSLQPVLKTSLVTDEGKEQVPVLPSTARSKKAEKDKTTAAGSKKKKDGTSKPAAKPKQPSKPRTKPVPKSKVRPNAVDPPSKGSIPRSALSINERSRSTSVIPGIVEDVPEPEVDESDKGDDKLYCVCKTRYDEDRMMIACDRCDEWFHTLCVNMPDLEIDLVDQFICPPCIEKHPHLRTTWKRRCLFGLQHENPSSPEACHKPSRGAFSKYCSDDCGIKSMQARITQWEKLGGARDLLWESVKNAAKREGVVVCAETNGINPVRMDVDGNNSERKPLDSAARRRAEREVARLNARLEEVVKEREFMKRELDMVLWREKVVELASERAERVGECGWDQRLCFGEEEWEDFGSDVLESYEERVKVESVGDGMMLNAATTIHGEWWCTGKKKCERHAGWQKLRAADVSFDRETKEGILLKLTTREREIRKCIEDILYPQPTSTLQAEPEPPHPGAQLNGSERAPFTSHVSERVKRRPS